jgi:H+/Cl- antiporter ClcA
MVSPSHIETAAAAPVHSRSFFQGLGIVCGLPVLVIAAVLVAAGGTRAGLIVPAIVAGAVIGLLMFSTLGESPRE